MKTFVLGDLHGAHKALTQCITRSDINPDVDILIFLGDIVDGWREIPECVEELLKFKNLVAIRGNHCQWFMNFAKTGYIEPMWYKQGGKATLNRYENELAMIQDHMEKYFNKTVISYVDIERNYAFMHGGYNWHIPLDQNEDSFIMWDRHMVSTAQTWEYEKYNAQGHLLQFKEFTKIFVGHTTTQWASDKRYKESLYPAFLSNLINLDTGAGWNGKLTIMDIDSLQYWQSDLVTELYPDEFNSRK